MTQASTDRGSELSLLGITKSFGGPPAVDHMTLLVGRREFVTILGPSGSGKSTALRIISGFIEPDEGQILIDGADVRNVPVERRPTAMLFQSISLWPHLNVARNISFGLELRNWDKNAIKIRVAELLDLVGLPSMGTRLPSELSGGEQQRIALARALALEPRILLLDEPFSSLDAKLRVELRTAVKAIQRAVGTTTILVTHDQEEAMELSDRIVVMRNGRIEQVGSPQEIYEQPDTRFVAEFVGTMNFIDGAYVENNKVVAPSLAIPIMELVPASGHGEKVLGVRPEDVVLDNNEDAVRATIESMTLRGHYKEISLRCGTHLLRSYVPKEFDVEVGQTTGVRFRSVHQLAQALAGAETDSDSRAEETVRSEADVKRPLVDTGRS
ncbi:MAG TPA: ABC transporter ATP-binding protein [Acidimicrobiales bacterium]